MEFVHTFKYAKTSPTLIQLKIRYSKYYNAFYNLYLFKLLRLIKNFFEVVTHSCLIVKLFQNQFYFYLDSSI